MHTTYRRIIFSMFISIFLFITGCASTHIISAWKNPEYEAGQIRKVAVIGVFRRPTLRHYFEEEFARRLKAENIETVPGYSVIKNEKMPEEALIAKIKGLNIDALLISRIVDKKTIETYYPPQTRYIGPPRPYYHNWYRYYRDSYNYVVTPGYTVRQKIVKIETSIYDTKTGNLVWSALSESYADSPTIKDVESFIAVLMEEMKSQGMLP